MMPVGCRGSRWRGEGRAAQGCRTIAIQGCRTIAIAPMAKKSAVRYVIE